MLFILLIYVIIFSKTNSFIKKTSIINKSKAFIELHDLNTVNVCVSTDHLDILGYALAGAVAGGSRALSKGLTYPFDTIKTLLQASNNDTIQYKKKLSISEYFRGVTPTVLSAVPANSLFFIVYYPLENYILDNCHELTLDNTEILLLRLFISTIATIPQNIIKIPAELIKQRAQTQPSLTYQQLMSQAMKDEGLLGLYCGWEAQLLREIPYNAFQMTSYSILSDIIRDNDIFQYFWKHSLISSAIEGLLAAGIAALLTQPADLIKTKVMTQTNKSDDNNIITASRKVYQTEGLAGFFVGIQARLSIVSIGGMIYFWSSSIVENMMK